MICKHFFLKIMEVSKPVRHEGTNVVVTMHRGIPGVEAGCINCGQIRRVYADGVVEVKVEGGSPIQEDA